MLKTIKIPVLFLVLIFLVFLPKASYAWGDQHGHDQGDGHHRHDYHAYSNSDLTLVSGMDTIDSRVLIAADPDQMPDVDQAVPGPVGATPAQTIGADMDTFIVNVPNNTGGYTPVLIKKSGNGYLGPQGELYYPFPEVSQLKAMYGL